MPAARLQESGNPRDFRLFATAGALARATGLFEVAFIQEQVRSRFGKKMKADLVEANVTAIRRAAEEITEG